MDDARAPEIAPRQGQARHVFGPGSLVWDGVGDRRFPLMFGSAFALQLMHPEIGSAVSQQSVFRTDPWGRTVRSLVSVQKWIYGGREAIAEAARLVELHKSIRGRDANGRAYNALRPGPWAWVPLTGFYSLVVGHRVFYGRELARDERDRLYAENLQLCRLLHVPERCLPPTVDAYFAYFDDMLAHTLEDNAMVQAYLNLWDAMPPPPQTPAVARPAWPLARIAARRAFRLATVGLLPPRAREIIGVSWTRADALQLRALGRLTAETFPRLPEKLRYMPIAYRARRDARRGFSTFASATR